MIPAYEVPPGDEDLLLCGVVLSQERIVEVWSHNAVADVQSQKRFRDMATVRRRKARGHIARFGEQIKLYRFWLAETRRKRNKASNEERRRSCEERIVRLQVEVSNLEKLQLQWIARSK